MIIKHKDSHYNLMKAERISKIIMDGDNRAFVINFANTSLQISRPMEQEEELKEIRDNIIAMWKNCLGFNITEIEE